MSAPLLVADLFCGAGGSSTGARRALAARGLRMQLVAVDHWSVAIATHTRNHPEAKHVCADLFRTAPREVVPGGRLDLLMASPTCTFHSRARGGRPISREQKYGRMTPTQVVRWVRELDVRTLLVENVPEFVEWGPVHMSRPRAPRCVGAGCAAERPCRARAGCYFRSWVRRLEGEGYRTEHRILNAADFGGATTRSRFFLLGRKDRRRIVWPAPTHAKRGGKPATGDLFTGPLKPWRGAREVIDWSLSGRSIFGRKKPLSPKTLARIQAGAVKFGWPEPFLALLRHHIENPRAPLPTFDADGKRTGWRWPEPVVTVLRRHADAQSLEAPLPTVTAGGTHLGIATPPFVSPFYGDKNGRPRASRGIDEPLATQSTENRFGLVEPIVLPQGGGGAARPVGEPVATIATDGAHALVAPYYGTGAAAPVTRPLPTVTTLVEPLVVRTDMHRSNAACVRGAGDPLATVTTGGGFAVATGRVDLVEGVAAPPVYDILFRMLTPKELARAMGFGDEYSFAGNKTESTKQIGNAVSVEQAAALVGAIVDAQEEPEAITTPTKED